MKITTNFATPAGWMALYLAGACFLLAVMAVIASMVLFISARQFRAEMPVLEEQLARYRNREIPVSSDLLSHDKLVALRAQVQALNGLSGTAGQALPMLLIHLEKLIPDGAWLVSLQYRSREGETKLVAEADRAERLTEFMKRLEQSGYFSQVLLTRQAQRQEGAQQAIQFEIQLRGKP